MKLLIFAFLQSFLFLSTASAQDKTVRAEITDAYNKYKGAYVQEKIFVHTDKDFYVSGEILWFRMFYVDAFYQQPLTISKMGYVELLDNNNRPVLQQKVSLKPGESNGSFVIPYNIATGSYKFRAYTRWMKNFGADYFFEKLIRIANPQKLEADSLQSKKKEIDIQFFPEGGNLVQDLESKVGFRITDAYGKGLEFKGELLNSNQEIVLKFGSSQRGIGHFIFTPLTGQTYHAVVHFPGGDQIMKELPAIYSGGYVMNLSRTADRQVAIRVKLSSNLQDNNVYLFIHNRASARLLLQEKLINSTASFLINPADFGEGISQCTIFNSVGEPVCERLYFRYPEKKLLINASVSDEYKTRKKIDLSISTSNQLGNPVNADLSLAVYRLDSLQAIDPMDIRNYLYLQSELGGCIESPEFYFEGDILSKQDSMDELMLTHGWRRFIWKEIQQQKPIDILYSPEFNGHIIQGKVIDNKSGAAMSSELAYLSVPSSRTQFRSSTSDANGKLKFEMTGFYASQEIIVQTNPKEDSTSHVEISTPFADTYSGNPIPRFSNLSKNSPVLLDQAIHAQVQHVYDGVSLHPFGMQLVDTNTFYVVPDEKYLLDDYTRFFSMEEVMREYIKSVDVARRKDKFQLYVFNNVSKKFFIGQPLILIDGVPVFETNELFQQNPMKIRRIDLINKQYSLGYQTFDGIVNVTSYRGDLEGIQLNPHALVLDYPGIPEERQFFSPVYETETQISSRMPDFRTLLYWAPQIKTGVTGKNQIQFYTSDLAGRYVLVVQGLTENGEPGTEIVLFNVRK